MAMIPGFFMIESLGTKGLLVLVFAFLGFLAGKKIRFFYFFFLIGSITFFHLLSPVGRILTELGPVKITSGALMTGLTKGLTLSGLVFLSLFSVTPDLKLPGKLGGLLARTFYYFEEILNGRKKISPRDFIGSLDLVLLELFPPDGMGDMAPQEVSGPKANALVSFFYVVFLFCLIWGTLLWQILM
jgi:heptaprenyl diphosphate synthase